MTRRRVLAGAVASLAASRALSQAAPPPRIGLALGSGALHGWAHVGIVRACERLGLRPHAVAGCSAGAAVGALWACGLDARRITELAHTIEWEPGGMLKWLWRGQRRHDALRRTIDSAAAGRAIEKLPMAFGAVASDLMTGEAVDLRQGPLGLAVEASCAVPLWFAPVPWQGRSLVDGSLTAPVPVALARRLGAEVVIAVDVAYRPHEETPSGSADHAFQALHILTNALAREQTQHADHVLKLDLHALMRPRFDPRSLIAAGESAMLALAPRLAR